MNLIEIYWQKYVTLIFLLYSREFSLVNDWQGSIDRHKYRPFKNCQDPVSDYNLNGYSIATFPLWIIQKRVRNSEIKNQ